MAVAPIDKTDKKLAEMYFDKVTVNLDNKSSLNSEDFWNSMELIAINNKAFIQVNKR